MKSNFTVILEAKKIALLKPFHFFRSIEKTDHMIFGKVCVWSEGGEVCLMVGWRQEGKCSVQV
jgi:hypothetical protein